MPGKRLIKIKHLQELMCRSSVGLRQLGVATAVFATPQYLDRSWSHHKKRAPVTGPLNRSIFLLVQMLPGKQPCPPSGGPEMSAVGDIHRDFETKTQIGEARGGPLHGESPVLMVESGGLVAADLARRDMPSMASVPEQCICVAKAEHDRVISNKRAQWKIPRRVRGVFT